MSILANKFCKKEQLDSENSTECRDCGRSIMALDPESGKKLSSCRIVLSDQLEYPDLGFNCSKH